MWGGGIGIDVEDSRLDEVATYNTATTVNPLVFIITLSSLASGEVVIYCIHHGGTWAFTIHPTSNFGRTLPDWNIYREWKESTEILTFETPDDLEWKVAINK